MCIAYMYLLKSQTISKDILFDKVQIAKKQ